MSDRIPHADKHESLPALSAATTHHADYPGTIGGHTMAILASSYRVVTKSGRLSGGRACALSARAAARNLALQQDR
jgi:hypothetical protein